MTTDATLTALAIIGVLATLILTRISADVVLMSALAFLVVFNILTPAEALAGFANTGVITIALLYVVAAGLRETGAVQFLANRLLGQPNTVRGAHARLLVPTSLLSAFMNNTAVVAMLIPAVQDWSQRIRIPASKLLIVLSYAAIMGGTLTLIGTSTNLVVDGLLQAEFGIALGLFDLVWVGVPVLVLGGAYLIIGGSRLLPEREGVFEQLSQAREYSVEMQVVPNGPIAGRTVAQAGLRHLQFSYLADVERNGQPLPEVSPDTPLESGDRLMFIGAPEGARELRTINGLLAGNGEHRKLGIDHHQRQLVEVVVGPEFPALGETIRDSRFRTRFRAVILSVSRGGQRVPGKLGEIRFQVGDTLLLEAGTSFVDQYRYRRDFLLVSALNDSTPPDFRKAPIALGLLAGLVLAAATGFLSILEAALLAAGGMLATRCVTATKARRAIDLSVLVVIAASFALGTAMAETGAASTLAGTLLATGTIGPWVALALVYVITVAFTEAITNNAAAVLMFPIASALAEQLGVNVLPYAIAIMFAASASFMTPLGYQTNLMVYGPGGYRFTDYFRVGAPLSLITGTTAVLLIPQIWSF